MNIGALQQADITDNKCLAAKAATAAIGQDPLLILSFQKKELKSAGIHCCTVLSPSSLEHFPLRRKFRKEEEPRKKS